MQSIDLEVVGQHVRLADSGAADRADAPAVVLVHGAGHDHGVWQEVASALAAAGLRVVAPDLPGHGGSAGEAVPDIGQRAEWLLRLLDALDLPSAWLVGHSMGSLITLAAAARAPQRVRGLVLIGSAAPMPVSPFLLDAARDDPPRAHELINKFSFAPAEMLDAERRDRLAADNAVLMARQPAASLLADLEACNAWQAGLDDAAVLRRATLLICGEFDRMTPPDAVKPLFDACAASLGGARMITLAGAGHAMMSEAAEAVSEAIRGFVAGR